MRRLLPLPTVDCAAVDALSDLPDPTNGIAVRVVMVQSVDGRIAVGGHSTPLSSPADQRVFLAARATADVVIVGATTARREGYGPSRLTPELQEWRRERGRPPVPPVAVISESLALDLEAPFFTAATVRPIVITTTASDEAARERVADHADLIVVDAPLDISAVADVLTARGYRTAVVEGGPVTVQAFLAADRVDEFCLSVSPQLVGAGPGPVPPLPAPLGVTLFSVLEDEGLLVLRYRRGPVPVGTPRRTPWSDDTEAAR